MTHIFRSPLVVGRRLNDEVSTWESRKRQQPDIGHSESYVRNAAGKEVRNKRKSFLRTRKRADGSVGQDVRWTAVIVESVRVYGTPRQRHVA